MDRALIIFALIASASIARADIDSADADTAPPPPDAIGVQLALFPAGSLRHANASERDHRGAPGSTSVAIGVDLAHARSARLDVGLAPRVVMNDDAQTQEFDLRLSVRYHRPVARDVEVHGFVAPGYVIVIGPQDLRGGSLDVGAGATLALAGNAFVSAELAVQFARVASSGDGAHAATTARYPHVGVGGGVRF